MRLRSIVLNLVAVIIGLILAVAVAEIALRLFGVTGSGGVLSITEQSFAVVPGIYEPNQAVFDRRIPALPFNVRINNLGFRGSDLPIAKPAREFRLLKVGDSFTFGDYVDDEETLPAQLQAQLMCRNPAIVVNAGMGGSSIATQRHLVERALVVSPDLVVLTFYENDIADLESSHWELLAENRAARSRFPMSIFYPVIRNMALWRFLQETRQRWQNQRRLDGDPQRATVERPESRQLLARQERLREEYADRLKELAQFLRENSVPFVLAAYPSHLTISGETDSGVLEWVEQLGREIGIQVVSFLEPLRSSGLAIEALYALPHDGHPTPRAYGIAAAHLVKELRQGAHLVGCE